MCAFLFLVREPGNGPSLRFLVEFVPLELDTSWRRCPVNASNSTMPPYAGGIWRAATMMAASSWSVSTFKRAAEYVDRILKGAKPSELPVQAPTKYELVLNLKAAKAIGLEIPSSLLMTADEVIE
jgi:hypothetical protein